MSRKTQSPRRGKILTSGDFQPPHCIDPESFGHLCSVCAIPAQNREHLRTRLENLVVRFAEEMKSTRPDPPSRDDRAALKRCRHAIGKAQQALKGPLGSSAVQSLSAAADSLPPIKTDWLREKFGHLHAAHGLISATSSEMHQTIHEEYEEDVTEFHRRAMREDDERRRDFYRTATPAVVLGMFESLDSAIAAAISRIIALPSGRGGRKALKWRNWFLVNLCQIYSDIKGRPTTGPSSNFVTFASIVLESVGWDHAVDSVEHAVPNAMRLWKNHIKKNRRFSNRTRAD